MSKKQNKDTNFSFKISTRNKALAEHVAEHLGISMGSYLTGLLLADLQARGVLVIPPLPDNPEELEE